jgi:hypothetical protein
MHGQKSLQRVKNNGRYRQPEVYNLGKLTLIQGIGGPLRDYANRRQPRKQLG